MNLKNNLFNWYHIYKRDLPWRNTQNPYYIWISEIILQQTRVNQGYDYFKRFIDRFPDIITLANSEEQDVLIIWQGLGYYSRARNIHSAAKKIMKEFNGIFPNKYEDILNLKGIGEYSAGAIASLAFKKPYPAIDGNVQRVISRLYEIDKPISSANGKNEIKSIVLSIMDKNNPDIFNQSLIELGALICKPLNPDCEICPINNHCFAFKNKTQQNFPVKIKTNKPRDRFFYYIVIKIKKANQEYIYINKRLKNDIWKNLYDFPLIESNSQIPLNDNVFNDISNLLMHKNFIISKISSTVKHQLSHQTIYATFIEIETEQEIIDKTTYNLIPIRLLKDYPLPKLIENYVEKILLH